MYNNIDVKKLRNEMKNLVPIIVASKKKTRDPELNKANFATCSSSDFLYGGSQKGYYFDGDPDRTEKYNTYWTAMKEWRNTTHRFTKLCALLAHVRGRKHFSKNSNFGFGLPGTTLEEWLKPEIGEFKK